MSKYNIVGYKDIDIKCPYEIKTLMELKITKKVNDHGKIYLTGIISENKKDTYIKTASINDVIEVREKLKGNIIFKGLVSNIKIKAVSNIYYLEVEGISHTYNLDIKLKSRSFQHKDMLYKDLIKKVIKDYNGSQFIDQIVYDKKLEKLIVQYNETDWQFLKRIISNFSSVLVPDSTSDKANFWVGIPEGKNIGNLDDFNYSIKRDIYNFRNTKENYNDSLEENDFTCYEIETNRYLNIGDKVTYKGKKLVIKESNIIMKNGILNYQYVLSSEKGINQNEILNKNIIGSYIKGKVIDLQKDNVKVHLSIDKEQNKDEAKWFHYSTLYASEGGCGWYVMPQMGDEVNLYFPKAIEDEAVVLNSNRKDNSLPKTSDPSTKYLRTAHNKEMKLSGNELMFTTKNDKDGKIYINLNEESGIEIHSIEPVKINSQKDISIEGDSKVDIKAKESVYFICGANSILMDGITYMKSTQVKMEGSQRS